MRTHTEGGALLQGMRSKAPAVEEVSWAAHGSAYPRYCRERSSVHYLPLTARHGSLEHTVSAPCGRPSPEKHPVCLKWIFAFIFFNFLFFSANTALIIVLPGKRHPLALSTAWKKKNYRHNRKWGAKWLKMQKQDDDHESNKQIIVNPQCLCSECGFSKSPSFFF